MIMGKNMMINGPISEQKPLFRFAGSIFLGSVAIGTLIAQNNFRLRNELGRIFTASRHNAQSTLQNQSRFAELCQNNR